MFFARMPVIISRRRLRELEAKAKAYEHMAAKERLIQGWLLRFSHAAAGRTVEGSLAQERDGTIR